MLANRVVMSNVSAKKEKIKLSRGRKPIAPHSGYSTAIYRTPDPEYLGEFVNVSVFATDTYGTTTYEFPSGKTEGNRTHLTDVVFDLDKNSIQITTYNWRDIFSDVSIEIQYIPK